MTPKEHLEQAMLLAEMIASKRADLAENYDRRAIARLILLNLKAYLKGSGNNHG